MNDPERSSLNRIQDRPDVVLNRARQQRSDHLLLLIRRSPRLLPAWAGLWVVLTVASLTWVIFDRQDSFHGAAVMMAISVASLVSSIAGFAFSAICGAMLFHFHDDPVHIVQIMITCSIANQAAMTWAARHDIDWRGLAIYFAGGAPGLAIGVWLLLHVDRTLYTQIFGTFLLAYGAYMFLHKPMVVRRQPAAADFLTGFAGGITGGAAGFPGAFVTVWCGLKGWDKARQRAVFQPFILVMQIAALLTIALARQSGANALGVGFTDLLFIPASLLGTLFGLVLYQRLSDRQFARVVNILLIVSGLSYVV